MLQAYLSTVSYCVYSNHCIGFIAYVTDNFGLGVETIEVST